MKPAGIGLDEMAPGNIITVAADGTKVDGTMPRHNEVFIHSEVLRARPDVQSVLHTHPTHAVAFSSLGKPLLPVGNEGTVFGEVPIFSETTDLIISAERGRAVAQCLGDRPALILRNHGIVTAGHCIEETVWLALKLDFSLPIDESAIAGQKIGTPAWYSFWPRRRAGQNSSPRAQISKRSPSARTEGTCTPTPSIIWCAAIAAIAARTCRRRWRSRPTR